MKPKKKFTKSEVALISALYEIGKTDEQIAKILGRPRKTFTDQAKYNGLTATIKKSKDVADQVIEDSLFARGKGMDYTETHTEFLIDAKSKKMKSETLKVKKVQKHTAPDVTACIFWLKNRRRKVWKDRHDIELPEGVTLQIGKEFLPKLPKVAKGKKNKKVSKKVIKKAVKK